MWYTATAIPFIYSFSGNSAASAPTSTFMCLWAIYIFPGSVYIFPSLTADTWMWKLGLRSRYSFSGNICFKFSAFCLCSVGEENANSIKHRGWCRLSGLQSNNRKKGLVIFPYSTSKFHVLYNISLSQYRVFSSSRARGYIVFSLPSPNQCNHILTTILPLLLSPK